MLINYPLGWFIYYLVPTGIIRHLFVISIGIVIQLYLYGWDILHVCFMGYGGYFLMIALPR